MKTLKRFAYWLLGIPMPFNFQEFNRKHRCPTSYELGNRGKKGI